MQINGCKIKTKCDIQGCKNLADLIIENDGEKKPILNVCSKCANDIYTLLAKNMTPKNIPAPFKNPKRLGGR